MAKITRYQGNLEAFGSSAVGQERIVFGVPTDVATQSDDLTENINAAALRGWGFLPLGNKPPREWFNSAHWISTQLSAYLHQMGVAEWHVDQEYHKGSFSSHQDVLWQSIQDDNTGNTPSADSSFWVQYGVIDCANTIQMIAVDAPIGAKIVNRERSNAQYTVSAAQVGSGDIQLSNSNWANLKVFYGMPVEMFGAVGDGVTDDYQALQDSINRSVVASLEVGKTYGITQPIDFGSSRDAGFVCSVLDFRPDVAQDNGRNYRGGIIKWIGSSSNQDMLHISTEDIGVEPVSAFQDSVFGVRLENILLDGNSLVDFGIYGTRIQQGVFNNVCVVGTNLHAVYLNGIYNGSYHSLTANMNNGSGLSIGRASIDYGWGIAQANAVDIQNWWGIGNGIDGSFDEVTNPLAGYGVGLFVHRGNFISGVRGEVNDGPSIIFSPSGSGNEIDHVYTELSNQLDIGGGQTAITQGRSTQAWGVWLTPRDVGAYGNSICHGVINNDHVRITGTAPSSSRPRNTLERLMLVDGINADNGSYLLIDCDTDATNITGSEPLLVDALTTNNFVQNDQYTVIAYASFDPSTGSISIIDSYNISSISYSSTGIYDISLDLDAFDTEYTVIAPPTRAGRTCAISNKAVTGFRFLLNESGSGAATDNTPPLTFIVMGKRKIA